MFKFQSVQQGGNCEGLVQSTVYTLANLMVLLGQILPSLAIAAVAVDIRVWISKCCCHVWKGRLSSTYSCSFFFIPVNFICCKTIFQIFARQTVYIISVICIYRLFYESLKLSFLALTVHGILKLLLTGIFLPMRTYEATSILLVVSINEMASSVCLYIHI